MDVDVKLLSRAGLVGCHHKLLLRAIESSTYHKLVLLELVRDLGNGDGARNLAVLGNGAWREQF